MPETANSSPCFHLSPYILFSAQLPQRSLKKRTPIQSLLQSDFSVTPHVTSCESPSPHSGLCDHHCLLMLCPAPVLTHSAWATQPPCALYVPGTPLLPLGFCFCIGCSFGLNAIPRFLCDWFPHLLQVFAQMPFSSMTTYLNPLPTPHLPFSWVFPLALTTL